jgi:hypothetical protein
MTMKNEHQANEALQAMAKAIRQDIQTKAALAKARELLAQRKKAA